MIDHHSYAHNWSICEIKAWKKFRPDRDLNPWPAVLYQLSSQAIYRPEFFFIFTGMFQVHRLSSCSLHICEWSYLQFGWCSYHFRSGFDDQDMERPSFTQPAVHPAVPLILSKPGAETVIQVSSNPVNCCMFTARKPLLVGKTFLAN